jgi:hypothetical protein
MKKQLSVYASLLLVTSALFFACNGDSLDNPDNPQTSNETAITDNLPESKGSNEVEGTYYNDNSKIILSGSSMEVYYSSEDTASSSARVANIPSDAVLTSTYKYSWDQEAKTITVQLQNMWESGAAKTYSDQVKAIKSKYSEIKTALLESLKDSSGAYQTAISNVNSAATIIGNANYGTTVDKLIQTRLTSYLESQEKILDDYLAKKYNATIKFAYDISTDGQLTLTQVYQNSLEDASANFYTDTNSLAINDYENFKPFTITITSGEESNEYVGVPEFKTENDVTTLSCDVMLFKDVMSESSDTVVAYYAPLATEPLSALTSELSDTSKQTAIATEIKANQTTTVEKEIDNAFASLTLTATASLNASDKNKPVLTLTDLGNDTITKQTYTLNYKSIFDFNGSALTEADAVVD